MALTQRLSGWNHYAETPAVPEKLAAGLIKPLKNLRCSSTDQIAPKNHQLCSEIAQLDAVVGGRIVRARISELMGPISAGRTSLAAVLAASVTYRGEVVTRTPRRIGECWYPEHSTDHQSHNVLISPALEDPIEVLQTLAHELIHVAAGPHIGHKGQFVKIAKAIGFKAPRTSIPASPALIARLNGLLVNLDPYPPAAIDKRGRKKQGTRLLQVICGAGGYTVRITQQWIDTGLPSWPCGTQMELVS